MNKGKKREATPKSPKVSPTSVDAPPAPKMAEKENEQSTEALPPATGAVPLTRAAAKYAETVTKSGVSPGSDPAFDTKTDIPEELEPVWDKDIAAAFQALRPQQQDFLLCYLREGNAAAAYRHAYNKLAKDHLASVCGSQALASTGINSILLKFASIKTEALFAVVSGYQEMAAATKPNWVQDKDGQWMNVGNDPDWQARKEAFLGMRKVHGIDAADKVEHSGQIATTHKYDIPNKRPVGT